MTNLFDKEDQRLVNYLKLSFQWHILAEFARFEAVTGILEQYNIQASKEELSMEMSLFRKSLSLITEGQLSVWLRVKNLTEQEFSEQMYRRTRLQKLKEMVITDQAIEAAFSVRKSELDCAEIYRILVTSEAKARLIKMEIDEGANFFSLAKQESEDQKTAKLCGYCGIIRRVDMRPEVESVVFASEPGSIVGPIKCAGQFQIVLIDRLQKAQLDNIREALQGELFEKWVQDNLAEAKKIET